MSRSFSRTRARFIATLLALFALMSLAPSLVSAAPPPDSTPRVEPRAALPDTAGEMTVRRALRVEREQALFKALVPDTLPSGVLFGPDPDAHQVFKTAPFEVTDRGARAGARARLEAFIESVSGVLPADVEVAYELYVESVSADAYWRARLVESEVIFDRTMVKDAFLSLDPTSDQPYVAVTLDDVGRDRLSRATTMQAGRMEYGVDALAIMVGDHLVSCPRVQEVIPAGKIAISVGSLPKDAEYLDAETILEAIAPAP